MREKVDATPMPVFAQNLIDEKNQEIDDLTEQLERLQADLLQAGSLDKDEVEKLVSGRYLLQVNLGVMHRDILSTGQMI